MILSNYWKMLDGFQKYPSFNNSADTIADLGLVNMSGTPISTWITCLFAAYDEYKNKQLNQRILSYGLTAHFGTGKHSYTQDSYTIEDEVGFSNVAISASSAVKPDNTGVLRTFTITGQNPQTSATRTITEVGLSKALWVDKDTSQAFMLAIVKLDTPIVVPSNGQFSLTVQWDES